MYNVREIEIGLYVLIHRVTQSSLSPESVEQVLRQKSLSNVHLPVMTITGTTAALCLDFIQNTETCRYLE